MRKAIVVVVGMLAGSMQLAAQGWKQIYPAWPVDEYTSITKGGGDTVYITAANFTLLRSTDRGVHWEYIFRTPGAYDIWSSGYDGTRLYLLPGGRPYYDALMQDTTQGFLYAFDPVRNDTTRIIFPSDIVTDVGNSYQIEMSVGKGVVFLLRKCHDEYRYTVLRSTDGGGNWSTVPVPDSLLQPSTRMFFRDRQRGFLLVPDAPNPQYFVLNTTTDGGEHWKRHPEVLFDIDSYNLEYPLAWLNDDTAIAVTANGTLMLSRDAGASWAVQNADLGLKPSSLKMSANGVGFIIGTGCEILRSVDFGLHWVNVRNASMRYVYNATCLYGDSTCIIINSDGDRVLTHDAGMTWTEDHVREYSSLNLIRFFPGGVGYARGQLNSYSLISEYLRTTDHGRIWKKFPMPFSVSTSLIPVAADVVFACKAGTAANDTVMLKTTDAGKSWALCLKDTIPFTAHLSNGIRNRGIDTVLVYSAADTSILKTTDGGASWKRYRTLPYWLGKYEALLALDFHLPHSGWAYTSEKVMRSTDDGVSWDTVFFRPPGADVLTSISIHDTMRISVTSGPYSVPYGPEGSSGQLYQSQDGGRTWSTTYLYGVNPGLWPDPLVILNGEGRGQGIKRTYAKTQGYHRWSLNSTQDAWTTFTTTYMLNSKYNTVFQASLDSRTCWVRCGPALYFTTTGGIDAADTPPEPASLALSQNYPNPFSTHTTIPYSISGNGEQQLRIELYDAMGRRVATLYDGTASAGEHVLPFDASGFVQGMYFVRLVTGGNTEVRKMVVVGAGGR